MLPEIRPIRKVSSNISVFRGLNKTDNTGFSRVARNSSVYFTEFEGMQNLCSDDYPRMSTRKPRCSAADDVVILSNILVSNSRLVYVTEVTVTETEGGTETQITVGKLVVDDELYTIPGYDGTADEHVLTLYGNRVIIMPEKQIFDLGTHAFTAMDFRFVSTGAVAENATVNNLDVTNLNKVTWNTGSYSRNRVINFQDFAIEKVALDDDGKPLPVNYIYEQASNLEDFRKQSRESNYSDDDYESWRDLYYNHWKTIKVGETVEAQGESPSGVYRCIEVLQHGFVIDGQSYDTVSNVKKFVKVENTYVKISRPHVGDTEGTDHFAGLKKGDFVKISGMTNDVTAATDLVMKAADGSNPAQTWSTTDWGDYKGVLNNNWFKVVYVDKNSIVIDARIEKSVPYKGAMTIERVMPAADSGKMLEVSNRLWTCSSEKNEIYSCKQGDATVWNAFGDGSATDSYAVTVGVEGDFTGIARQNDSVIFFKENWILRLFGTKPSNYSLASYNVLGVERGSEKSIVWINGVLFYLSPMGVCQYSPGGQPVVISKAAFGNQHYQNGVAGRHRNKYFLSAQNESGTYELFVFDTDSGMWHKEDNTQIKDCVSYNNVMYFTTADGALVCCDAEHHLLGDDAEEEGAFEWSFLTGNLYEEDFGKKYISRLQLLMKCEDTAEVKIYAQFEREGVWRELRTIHHMRRGHGLIPVPVRRSDYLKLKVEGTGKCQISEIQIDFSRGSEKVWQY